MNDHVRERLRAFCACTCWVLAHTQCLMIALSRKPSGNEHTCHAMHTPSRRNRRHMCTGLVRHRMRQVFQKARYSLIPFSGPENGHASAGRPRDIHCECLGPVPRPCVQKLGARIGPRRKQFFGAASQSAMISAGQKRLFACSKTSYGRTCSCHCSLWSWWRRASRNFMARQSAAMLASATLK